jgi:hypothetical protein
MSHDVPRIVHLSVVRRGRSLGHIEEDRECLDTITLVPSPLGDMFDPTSRNYPACKGIETRLHTLVVSRANHLQEFIRCGALRGSITNTPLAMTTGYRLM